MIKEYFSEKEKNLVYLELKSKLEGSSKIKIMDPPNLGNQTKLVDRLTRSMNDLTLYKFEHHFKEYIKNTTQLYDSKEKIESFQPPLLLYAYFS